MRIGLTIEHFDSRRGGVEHWTVQFVRRLAERGHHVAIVARSVADADHVAGVAYHLVDANSSRTAFADAAAQQLSSLRLDVTHDTGCGWYADVFSATRWISDRLVRTKPAIMSPALRPMKRVAARLLPRYREFQQLLNRQYGDHRRLFIALSRMVASDLAEYHHVPSERIRIVYNGVDTQQVSVRSHRADTSGPYARPAWCSRTTNDTLLLILAHNFRLKGVATAIRSGAVRLAREGLPVCLAVAGGGTDRDRTGDWPSDVALPIGYTFSDAVDDPVPLYAAADVYVQPTWYDPCSLVVLEALAAGLPVVTTRLNGAGELITSGREGDSAGRPQR